MNKKGFVLLETIVVIVVVSVSMLTLFSSYNKILNKMKSENRFDTPEYLYMVNSIKERMKTTTNPIITQIFDFKNLSQTPIDHLEKFDSDERSTLDFVFGVKHIYLITGVSHDNTNENLKKFPPSVVEYIKKIDVSEKDELIVVVFERNVYDGDKYTSGNKYILCPGYESSPGRKYCATDAVDYLRKTYVASLKW